MQWKKLLLSSDATLLDAMCVINDTGEGFTLVLDNEQHLLGILTEGNIRRALIKGNTIHSSVRHAMNSNPVTVPPSAHPQSVLNLLQKNDFTHIPVVDAQNILVDVWSRKGLASMYEIPNRVVLMVGGRGTRLGDLTKDCPKPLLEVGGKPLLEIIVNSFAEHGLKNFYFAVNYHAEKIEKYFGDGSSHNVRIAYLREEKPMGTAGALSLLFKGGGPEHPVIVMNGDILTRLNPRLLLAQHSSGGMAATMVIRRHTIQIPYGVITTSADGGLTDIQEKPQHTFQISAGINVFSPEALTAIPHDTFFDVPDLISALLKLGRGVDTYTLDEYWLDIGQPKDYEKAQNDVQYFLRDE
jgi:dTDP-glucose pyrophosphorylase/predicted transcriptional regulator